MKKLLVWIVSAAILMGVLASTLAGAPAAGAADGWAEVCTSLGTRVVRVDDTPSTNGAPQAPGVHMMEHCPYCSLHVSALGMPPAILLPVPVSLSGFDVPALFLHSPRTLFAWLTAQPRAPPRIT